MQGNTAFISPRVSTENFEYTVNEYGKAELSAVHIVMHIRFQKDRYKQDKKMQNRR